MLLNTHQNNPVVILDDTAELAAYTAQRIADYVRREPEGVLGLFTGGTPVPVYNLLAQWSAEKKVDFSGITCFNLDERYPIEPDAPQSFSRFMRENFFDHVKVREWHIPDGRERSAEQIADDCAAYEEKIRKAGGIGLQGLGIGYNGHIGYNEPGSAADSRTRLVSLHSSTVLYAASEYKPGEYVHRHGITMGIGTIMEAREIIQMASNAGKVGGAMRDTLANAPDKRYPSTLLKPHKSVTFCMTTEVAAPWLRLQAGNRGRPDVQLLQNRT